MASSENLVYLDDSNFEHAISKGVTLVDFYADWCGPCRMIAPLIEELSDEMKGQAKIAKLDIENAQQAARDFEVTSIPTVIVFKDGKEFNRAVGLRDKKTLKEMITSAL